MADWHHRITELSQTLFRISTPDGYGTGFLIHKSGNFIALATAHHVIEHAKEWDEPIRLTHHTSGKTCMLTPTDRTLKTNRRQDLAVIIMRSEEFEVESPPFPLIEEGSRMRQGVELGWCGFPVVAPNDLCFFHGHVSSYLADTRNYLVDGVAINGVSGGPAFTEYKELCGVVTAYIPNRATGEALPGVCIIQNITPIHSQLEEIKSFEEAQETAEDSDPVSDESEPAVG